MRLWWIIGLLAVLAILLQPILNLYERSYTIAINNKSGEALESLVIGGNAIDEKLIFNAIPDGGKARLDTILNHDGNLRFWATQGRNKVDGIIRSELKKGQSGGVQINILPFNHYIMGVVDESILPVKALYSDEK